MRALLVALDRLGNANGRYDLGDLCESLEGLAGGCAPSNPANGNGAP